MRRISLLFILCLCAMGAFAYNEAVAAISYNPSRLGAYTYLKAVKEANLAGGLDMNTAALANEKALHIRSQGTVRMTRSSYETCTNDQCNHSSIDKIENIKPITQFNRCPEDGGKCETGSTQAETEASMHYTRKNSGGFDGTNIEVFGGKLVVSDEENQNYIEQFVNTSQNLTVARLTVTATSLSTGGPFYSKDAFTLGKIEIGSAVCSGSCTEYKFVEQEVGDNKKVKVLAVVK